MTSNQIQADILKTLDGGDSPIKILTRTKDEDLNRSLFKEFLDFIPSHSIGIFPKDKFEGKFITAWDTLFTHSNKIDFTAQAAAILVQKDEDEIKAVKTAAKMTNQIMKAFFIEELETILDQDTKISHEKLATDIEKIFLDEKLYAKIGFPADSGIEQSEFCYTPIIQSGGVYDLKVSAMSSDKKLSADIIICSLGVRFKSYCTNIGRTFLVDPTPQQEKDYKFLVTLHDHALESLTIGTSFKEAHGLYVLNKITSFVEKKRPDLLEFLTKTFGFSMGLEFRDSLYQITNKNNQKIKPGMVINLQTGFQNIPNGNKTYALLISDTILMTSTGSLTLTPTPKEASEISYIFKDPETTADSPKKTKRETSEIKNKLLPTKVRGENVDGVSNEMKRAANQKVLAAQTQQRGLQKYSGTTTLQQENEIVYKKYESYKKETQLPKQTINMRIIVDKKSDSIILPIAGACVPFHVSTLKNVTKNDEGEYIHLRFNFITPGPTSKKEVFMDANATFIKSLAFKSQDAYRFQELFKETMELRKDFVKRDAEKKELADLIVLDKLIEQKGKRPTRLPDVFVRPAEGKKTVGDLEIHVNGLRYVSQLRSDQRIDIPFSNINHMFYQPNTSELITILHINLHNPIMIGKKKTKDVQVYREVGDASFDETGNRKRRFNYGDEDELEQEQEERRLRQSMNKEFKEFAEKVSDAVNQSLKV